MAATRGVSQSIRCNMYMRLMQCVLTLSLLVQLIELALLSRAVVALAATIATVARNAIPSCTEIRHPGANV